MTNEQEVEAAVAAAAEADGGLRIGVNCAGIGWAERISHKRGPHKLAAVRDRHPRSTSSGRSTRCGFESAAMAQNDPGEDGERGVCVNTASIAAFDGQIGQVAYSASKGGVVGLTLPAARDLVGVGVRVNTIAPGLFDTPLLAALPQETREALGADDPVPQAARPARRVRAARLHDRREHDAQRRDDPARRRAADGAEVGRAGASSGARRAWPCPCRRRRTSTRSRRSCRASRGR